MKLSIITINRNNAAGLRKTIESVASQSFTNLEYIIVDGASTDRSVETIKQFNGEFSHHPNLNEHFQWISEPDSGVFNAMNKGIRMAKGEYLLFLNSGDFLVNESVIENVFVEDPSEDIVCGKSLVSDKGKIIHTTNPPDAFKLSHFYQATIAHQATFIKKSLFDHYGLYREDLKLMSDWEFWIRTIILGVATTKKIDVIVSDYNLDGISSDQKNRNLSALEVSKVYTDLGLQKIIPDYLTWEENRKEMYVMYWVKSKAILYKPLELLHKCVAKTNNLFKQ